MRLDRALADRIKNNLARKSITQLQAIAESDGRGEWSQEAVVAASELLLDRAAGRADEPPCPEEEQPPPATGKAIDRLALFVGINAIAIPFGAFILPVFRSYEDDPVARDVPVPFGPGTAWVALDTADTEAAATALSLRGTREATWKEGLGTADRSLVFITPPVGDWTLAVSAAFFPPRQIGVFVKPLLELLSEEFGNAQYFLVHEDAQLYAWARARGGRLIRGFGWFGLENRTLWDEGTVTKKERDLGLPFAGGQPPEAPEPATAGQSLPTAEGVLDLASYWSLDPTTLNEHFKEPVMGVLGRAAWFTPPPNPGADHKV